MSALIAILAGMQLPDPDLTPGVADTVVVARHVTLATKRQVFKRYGIPMLKWPRYTIDHLVPLELGGTNDLANLWPQPRAEAKLKDRDEDALARSVARGTLSLTEAQQHILTGWTRSIAHAGLRSP